MIKSYSSSSRAQAFLEAVLAEFDASDPTEALHLLRRMKRLLSQYHQERKRLDRLGLDGLDEVFDVMLAMKRRVDHLREQVEAHREAQDKLHAIQDALDVEASPAETVATIQSISEQLESLYEEREVLSRAGVSDATEAVRMIETMREQLDEMYEERDQDASDDDPFGRIQRELGVSDPESVIDMVESMEAQTAEVPSPDGDELGARASSSASTGSSTIVRTLERQMLAAQRGEAEIPRDEGPPLLSPDQLETLDDQSPEALAALDVGVVALDEDARLRLVTEHSPLLPGLSDAGRGESFLDCVPAARNPLLRPLLRGPSADRVDARFLYTFPRPGTRGPLPLRLHLYRSGPTGATWLLYDALR